MAMGTSQQGVDSHQMALPGFDAGTDTKHDATLSMRLSAIVSNPPYQEMTGGANASARPIYPDFVYLAEATGADCISVIMPARWYAGGRNLDAFRDHMIDHPHMAELHDFPDTGDCFGSVNIRGGVCFFLIDAGYDSAADLTRVTTHDGNSAASVTRPLRIQGVDVLVRSWEAKGLLDKVADDLATDAMSAHVGRRMAFGIPSNVSQTDAFHASPDGMSDPIGCHARGRTFGYVEEDLVKDATGAMRTWKVFAPRANNIGTELVDDNLNSFVGRPSEVSTAAYVPIGHDLGLDGDGAEALAKYLRTKFARTLHSLAKSAQDLTPKTMRFLPVQDFSRLSDIDWDGSLDEIDEQLFDKYGLTDAERDFVRGCVVDQAPA